MVTLKGNGIPDIFGCALTAMLIIALACPAGGQTREGAGTEELLHNLSHKDAKIRGDTAWALGKSGDERVIDPLIKALEDSNRNVREWAALALVKIGRPAVEPLRAAIKSKNDSVKWQTVAILGLINDSNATETLSQTLESNNSTVRYWAAASLGQIKDNRSRDALISVLGDGNETVRNEAGWAVQSLAGEGTADLLIRLLKDNDPNRRMAAAHSLDDPAEVRAAPALIEALHDSEPGVRSEAAAALGWRGESQAIMPLIEILDDPEEQVRKDGIKALTAIGSPATGPLILAMNGSDNITQAGAAQALGQIGEDKSLEPLIWSFKNGDGAVRHAAVAALVEINKSYAVDPLIQVLGDRNIGSDLRADAAWALGEMDDPRAKEPLIYAMSYDKDNSVRMNAARAMKKVMRTIFDQ